MTPIEITLTNAGLQALVNAQANGSAAVAITSYGVSEAPLAATPDMTVLPNELKRLGTVSGGIVSPNTIHVVLQDTGGDAYALRAFALYLSDGTLFGVFGQADPLMIKTAGADMLIAADIQFANTDVTNIAFGSTNFFNPPATETVVGVAEIATQDEASAGTDDQRFVTPKKAKGAVVSWLGFTPIQQGGGIGQQGNRIRIGWSGTRLKLDVDGTDLGNLVTDNVLAAGIVGINGVAMNRNNLGLWGPDNDGAGSGLDADLLDGQDGGYYTNITARLGYAPANRAGDTFTGDISVAHPGSAGIALNSVGVVIGTLVAQSDGVIVMYRNNGSGQIPVWYTDGSNFIVNMPISRQGQKVWDSGNDGAGSGLDADLLDGLDSGYFTDIVGRLGYRPANKAGDTFDGEVSAVRLRARSNGDGQAVAIGDDAWIGDNNITSGVSIRGQNNAAEGYVAFGNTTTALGCYGNDPTLRYGGNQVWHAGNDGAGSGLDADLFAGQGSGYYTNIVARLGYTPANRAGDAFSGDVTIGYAGSPALILNSGGVVAARLAAQSDGQVVLYRNPGNGYAVVFNCDGSSFNANYPITRQGNKVWDAANDGAGSGLDADLLDGQDSGYYTDVKGRLGYTPASASDFDFGSNDNGYWEKRPNGVIEQWGTAAGRSSEGAVQINFPIAFTDQASVRVFPVGVNVNASNRYDVIVQRVLITANGATVYCQWSANDNSSAILDGVDWRAIGR